MSYANDFAPEALSQKLVTIWAEFIANSELQASHPPGFLAPLSSCICKVSPVPGSPGPTRPRGVSPELGWKAQLPLAHEVTSEAQL